MLKTKIIITFLVSLLMSTITLASGGYHSGSSSKSYGSSGNYSSDSSKKNVDSAYEYGKAVYSGRAVNNNILKYCIYENGKSVDVKATSIKQLEGVSYYKLAQSLHNCANTQQTMADLLDGYQINSVAYYLDKRFKLNLSG